MIFVPESIRWLTLQGQHDKALENLAWVRGGRSHAVEVEIEEIRSGIEADRTGSRWKDFRAPANLKKIVAVVSMQLGVQLTGNTSLGYFAPQFFVKVTGSSAESAALITGCFGLVKISACAIYITLLVKRIGRKTSFMGGATAMGTFMLIICLMQRFAPPLRKTLTSTGIASVAMIYLESASYNMSWGPVSWLYCGEVFSMRNREIGGAIGTAAQWLFNFCIAKATPHMLADLGVWKTFMIFAIFNFALVPYAWFILRETKDKSIEQMDAVFSNLETANAPKDVELAERNSEDRSPVTIVSEHMGGDSKKA